MINCRLMLWPYNRTIVDKDKRRWQAFKIRYNNLLSISIFPLFISVVHSLSQSSLALEIRPIVRRLLHHRYGHWLLHVV